MKYLRLLICITTCVFAVTSASALADEAKSVQILVAKSDDTTVKITMGLQTYPAPIRFENGNFSWNDVKDGYSVTPAFASLIKQGRVSIYIGCSGATFSVIPFHAKADK